MKERLVMLQFMGLQRVRQDLTNEQKQKKKKKKTNFYQAREVTIEKIIYQL